MGDYEVGHSGCTFSVESAHALQRVRLFVVFKREGGVFGREVSAREGGVVGCGGFEGGEGEEEKGNE